MPRPFSETIRVGAPATAIVKVAGPRRPTPDGLNRTVKTQDGCGVPVPAGKPASVRQPVFSRLYSAAFGPPIVKVVPVKTSGSLPWLNSVRLRSSVLSLSTSTPGSAGSSKRLDALTFASGPGLPCSWT